MARATWCMRSGLQTNHMSLLLGSLDMKMLPDDQPTPSLWTAIRDSLGQDEMRQCCGHYLCVFFSPLFERDICVEPCMFNATV